MNTMHITTNKEYKVLLTHQPLHTQADGQQWRAMVLEFPSIVEEALSREEVLKQIKIRIDEMTRNAEVVILTAPALPLAQESPEETLAAQGWDDHGLFRNDPEALQLFDAIEEGRDRHQVGDVLALSGTPTFCVTTSKITRSCWTISQKFRASTLCCRSWLWRNNLEAEPMRSSKQSLRSLPERRLYGNRRRHCCRDFTSCTLTTSRWLS